jgi:hypothetical protein
MLTPVVTAMALGRILLGLTPMVAAGPAMRLLGVPEQHDNPTARLMARLFGVRDIGLGVLLFAALQGIVPMWFAILFNAATDMGDTVMITVPLAGRHGIDRTAGMSLALACSATVTWLAIYFFLL